MDGHKCRTEGIARFFSFKGKLMVIILRGITGSGKSHIVDILMGKNKMWEEHSDDIQKDCEWAQYVLGLRKEMKSVYIEKGISPMVFSADHAFTDKDGKYNFDARKLPEAHAACLLGFTHQISTDPLRRDLIVDNTNCSVIEVAPYAALAAAYAQPLRIITLLHDVEDCAKRNTHKVPTKNVIRQYQSLMASMEAWPPWWPQDVFFI